MLFSLNLTQKFVAFLFMASVIPLAVVGLVANQVARSTVEEQARRNAAVIVAQQAEFLELNLEQIEGLMVNISGIEKITQALVESPGRDGAYNRLATQAQIGESLGDFSTLRGLVSLDIFTFSGEYFHVGDTLDVAVVPEVRDHIMLNARAEGAGRFWSGFTPNVNASSQAHQVVTVARLLNATPRGSTQTRPVAVLMATYDVGDLYEHFRSIDLGVGAMLLVADADSRIIYHPDRGLIGSRLNSELIPLLDAPGGTFTIAIDQQELVATYTRLSKHNWVVVSLIPTETLTAGAATITQAMMAAILVALAIICIAALAASRSIVAPLRHLKRRFQLYQTDTPGWQVPVPVSGHDEVAELGRWFNLFTETLVVRRKIEEQLRHQAFHDSLTGLPNRKYFLERLEQALVRAQSPFGAQAAVLFFDLDRFKNINDSLGHAAGDRVLTLTAGRVAGVVRASDFLARLGGDEFAILLTSLGSPEEAGAIAERVQQSLAAPFELAGVEVIPQASMGIAMISGAYKSAEDLLRDADTAMYQAKASGRACSVLFDGAMHQRSIERLRLEADLRRAIERDELLVTYQPIVNLATGRLKGFETLVRWQHPERGRVSPVDFIPLAEETDLIRQIDMWVLRAACTQLAAWRLAWGGTLTVSVNLSARNFQDPRLPEQIGSVLAEAGLPPEAVQLEITESAVMADLERTIAILERLRAQGLTIAIDDFGTNYSSLAYLKRLPAHTVKIDRSFVSDVTESADSAAIASAIIAMGHILGLTVVAEGVETDAHRAFLTAHRCDAIQGYLISPPLPADGAALLLRTASAQTAELFGHGRAGEGLPSPKLLHSMPEQVVCEGTSEDSAAQAVRQGPLEEARATAA